MGINNELNLEKFFTFEISINSGAIDWSNPPDIIPELSDKFAKILFGEIISNNIFDFAIAPKDGWITDRNFFNLWLSDDFTENQFKLFESLALKGSFVIGLSSNCTEILELFKQFNWQIIPDAVMEVNEYFDYIPENKKLISASVRLCTNSLLVFCHDADPIYLLVKKEIEGENR